MLFFSTAKILTLLKIYVQFFCIKAMKDIIQKTLTMGQDDVYFEVIDQLNTSVIWEDNKVIQTTFSKLRAWSSPTSKTSQVANVIPLASNYLENWEGVGPLHDLKPGAYRSLLEKKGLVRCSLTATSCELKDPTEHALKSKCYSWQYGAWSPNELLFQGFYPLATIQQGNFVFSFFQNDWDGKVLIWSVATFEEALQSGELQWIKGGIYSWDKATQLIVEPTSLSPVDESKNSSWVNWSSFVDKQVQFTFGAPLETVQGAFDWKEPFLFCWVEMIEEQSQGKLYHYPGKSKPVETTPSALNPEELGNYYQKDNINTYPLDDEEDQNGVQLIEGNVYTIGRQTHCVSDRGDSENILAWFETPCRSNRYWVSLLKDTEDLFSEALNQAENSTTFSVLDVGYCEEGL